MFIGKYSATTFAAFEHRPHPDTGARQRITLLPLGRSATLADARSAFKRHREQAEHDAEHHDSRWSRIKARERLRDLWWKQGVLDAIGSDPLPEPADDDAEHYWKTVDAIAASLTVTDADRERAATCRFYEDAAKLAERWRVTDHQFDDDAQRRRFFLTGARMPRRIDDLLFDVVDAVARLTPANNG